MRLTRKITLSTSLCFLSLLIFLGISSAEPGIKITEPKDGSIVHPGEEITVRIEAVDGLVIEGGVAHIAHSPHNENIWSLPWSFTDKIPLKAIGEADLSVLVRDVSGNIAVDDITLIVQQTAALQSLQIDQDKISVYLDWDGNIKKDSPTCGITTVYGLYSDGIERILDNAPGTIYASSDPSIISVDNKGDCIVHKVGQASITVSNSGITKVIPVVFEPPTGIRPSETISPTTSIDIQPPPNSAGWNNTDITITLTAQDNEGGSGVQYIDYRFPRLQGEYEYKRDNQVIVPFSQEGEYEFWYAATDNEVNREDVHSITIRLDKTPPSITSTITPGPNLSGWHNSDVTVSFTALDTLSGVKSVTPAVTVSTEGANQTITGEAIDLADNKTTSSFTINLDKTPPTISLELKPINLSNKEKEKGKEEDEGNWYELLYSAQDSLSGLKSLKAGLAITSLIEYNIKLEMDDELNITIDEEEKELEIDAPNPQEILTHLQSGLLTLNNNQILQLKLKQGEPKWKINQKDKGIEIQASSIIFRAKAEDIADNVALKELEFRKNRGINEHRN